MSEKTMKNMSISDIKKRVENCELIILDDYSDYQENSCYTGGNYGFTDLLVRDGSCFRIEHSTTADFTFCPVCGKFEDHWLYDDESDGPKYSCGDYKKISLNKAAFLVKNYKKQGYTDCYIMRKSKGEDEVTPPPHPNDVDIIMNEK